MLHLSTLDEITGRDSFKKLLGSKVYDSSGEYVGYLKRVYLDKKRGRAAKIVVRLLNGSLLVLDPKEAFLDQGGRIVLKSSVKVAAQDISADVARLERLVAELRGLRERIFELDEAFIAGELSKETYQRFRAALEQRKGLVLRELRQLIERVEPYLHKLEEERKALLQQVDGGSGRALQALQKLRELRERLSKFYELVDSAVQELAIEMELDEFIERYLRRS